MHDARNVSTGAVTIFATKLKGNFYYGRLMSYAALLQEGAVSHAEYLGESAVLLGELSGEAARLQKRLLELAASSKAEPSA